MTIDYALPVYLNTLNINEIARLEQIQYIADKIVTEALQFTNKEKLNIELNSDFLGLNIFQKIYLNETRPLIRNCMTKLDFES